MVISAHPSIKKKKERRGNLDLDDFTQTRQSSTSEMVRDRSATFNQESSTNNASSLFKLLKR